MENLLRPLIALGLGLLLGVGGHAAFQSVSQSPGSKASAAASIADQSGPARAKSPGARPLGDFTSDRTAGDSKSFEEGKAAAKEDGATLLAKLSTMTDGRERDDFVRGVFSVLAMKSPQEAMDLALQLEDPRLQSLAVKTLALEWAFDPATLGSESSLENAMFGAVVALSSTNPEKAALLAQTNLDGRTRQYALMSVAKQWALHDPEGALAWMGTMEKGESGRLAAMVTNSVAETDPALAANYLDQIQDDRGRQYSASRLAESWFKKDAKAAVEWAANVQDPAMKERAVSSVAEEWAESDPQGAVEWAQALGDPKATRTAVRSATREWAQSDPASAASYATALPAGEVRTAALGSVARGWSSQDAEAAKAWAQSLTVPEEREIAVQSLRSGDRGRGGDRGGDRGGPR